MTIHICRGVNRRFQARVRMRGYRRYIMVGKCRRELKPALMDLARAFASGHYKRGDVLHWADYYDPKPVCKITRP